MRKRLCSIFSGSSPCLLGQHGSCSSSQLPVDLSENMLQNLFLNLPPHSVEFRERTRKPLAPLWESQDKFHNAMQQTRCFVRAESRFAFFNLTRKKPSMASREDFDFSEEANSGASLTFPVKCSSLKKSGYVMIGKRPGKIVSVSEKFAG